VTLIYNDTIYLVSLMTLLQNSTEFVFKVVHRVTATVSRITVNNLIHMCYITCRETVIASLRRDACNAGSFSRFESLKA